MTTDTAVRSQGATDAEIAAAAQEAETARQRDAIRQGQQIASDMPGTVKPMTYVIPESDAAAHVLVWELKLDVDGQEYGIPRSAPRGQLGLWLQKRREADGGLRFTASRPARIAAEPQYPCIHQECRKRLYTRQDVVDHVENVHPREARLYRKLLDEMMAHVAEDNPRVAEMMRQIGSTQERGMRSVPADGAGTMERGVDTQMGTPVVSTLGVPPELFDCQECDWEPKPGTRRPALALAMHISAVHNKEVADVPADS